MVEVNETGWIIGTAGIDRDGGSDVTTGWVYRMDRDQFYLLPTVVSGELHRVRGIDSSGRVVGWTRSSVSGTAHDFATIWEYDAVNDEYDVLTDSTRQQDREYWGITLTGVYIVGSTVNGSSEPSQAYVWNRTSSMSATPLDPAASLTKSAGMSIADRLSPLTSGGWIASGFSSNDGYTTTVPTVWNYTGTGIALKSAVTSQQWAARRVGGGGEVIGWRYDAGYSSSNPYRYYNWHYAGSGTWNSENDLSLNYSDGNMIDANLAQEYIVGKTFHYYDTAGYLTPYGMGTADWISVPTYINSASWRYYGLNNRGWMVGKAQTTDSPAVQRIIIAMPRDDDNNSLPDYRDIYASADPGTPGTFPVDDTPADWLLDKIYLTRPGLHAPGAMNVEIDESMEISPLAELDHVYITRNMTDNTDIEQILTCGEQCAGTENFLNEWGCNENDHTDRPKEIIYTLRCVPSSLILAEFPAEDRPRIDYIPDVEDQEVILANIRALARKYTRNIDYLQIGNEIWTGNGEYAWADFASTGCLTTYYQIFYSELPGCAVEEATTDVLVWIAAQSEAARVGAILGGRPTRLIAPAVGYKFARNSEGGDPEGSLSVDANRNAYAIKSLVELANALNMICDYHMWFTDVDEMAIVATWMAEGGDSEQWDAPNMLACLEFGALPTNSGQGNWWIGQDGLDDATKLTNDNPSDNGPYDNWDELVTTWLTNDTNANLPSSPDFVNDGIDDLTALGYRAVLWGPSRQFNDVDEFFMGAMWADQSDTPGDALILTQWEDRFEAAADDFDAALDPYGDPWDPHPDICDVECPEDCE